MKPVRLIPAVKDYPWGGDTLKNKYGKLSDSPKLAECWELSFHPDGPCRLNDGRLLMDVVGAAELGENVATQDRFPLLVKLIDARESLSVQVHPSDEFALVNEGELGKTEMWYIIAAEEGAGIYLGFERELSAGELDDAIRQNRLAELLHFQPVSAGDHFFIPAGTVHAIGSGCLICEIQQSSNVTYRVYDWGRVDKQGKSRPLHIDKAKSVAKLGVFANKALHIPSIDGEIIGVSKYFHTTKIDLCGTREMNCDSGSFRGICCVCGSFELDGEMICAGETVFLPAGYGKYKLKGEATVIMTQVRKYYVGIDLGGTFIKGGIVDDLGQILVSDKVPTESNKGADAVAKNIAGLVSSLLAALNLTPSDVEGVGMGVPGMINGKAGEVTYSNNLNWKHFPIGKKVAELTGMKVKIANDANVAALGEVKFGGGKEYETVIMITLGTGVGGGAVLDGRLFEGNEGAGAEFGHSCICFGGELCTCGRRGCLEAYASATALIRDTKRAMEAHPDSKMWQIAPTLDKVDGATAFSLKDSDPYAREVVEHYVEMLGTGLVNIAAVFRPQAILLGGGVSAEGEVLTKPLQKYVDENIFAGDMGPGVKILIATLGNKAGLVGAAALLMQEE